MQENKNLKSEKDTLARVEFRVGEALLVEIDKAAGSVPRNEFIAKVLAEHLGCPELGEIPRISIGRPRKQRPINGKKQLAIAR